MMATHDTAPWIGRMRKAAQKPRTTARMPGARIFPLKGVGKRNAAAALGLVLQPPCPCTRQLLAQAGCQARVTSRPDPGALALPHDDVPIEIQILTRSCKPSLIRMPVPYRSWANKRCSPSRKPEMRTTSSGVSTWQAPRRPRLLRSPGSRRQIRAQHLP